LTLVTDIETALKRVQGQYVKLKVLYFHPNMGYVSDIWEITEDTKHHVSYLEDNRERQYIVQGAQHISFERIDRERGGDAHSAWISIKQ
jgi:hypothetical protein